MEGEADVACSVPLVSTAQSTSCTATDDQLFDQMLDELCPPVEPKCGAIENRQWNGLFAHQKAASRSAGEHESDSSSSDDSDTSSTSTLQRVKRRALLRERYERRQRRSGRPIPDPLLGNANALRVLEVAFEHKATLLPSARISRDEDDEGAMSVSSLSSCDGIDCDNTGVSWHLPKHNHKPPE